MNLGKEKKYIWSIDGELPTIDDHSKVKLDIIAEYLQKYLEIYSQYPQIRNLKLTIVDGFAGGGLYKGDIAGSPIRILDSVKKAKDVITYSRESQNLPKIDFSIDYHFVEKCKEAFDFLSKTIDDFGFGNENINSVNAKFESSLEQIIQIIKSKSKSERCLFILDQYGYMDATIATVKHIFSNVKNAEVILTFSTDSLIDYINENNAQLLIDLGLKREDIEEIMDAKDDNHNTRAKNNYSDSTYNDVAFGQMISAYLKKNAHWSAASAKLFWASLSNFLKFVCTATRGKRYCDLRYEKIKPKERIPKALEQRDLKFKLLRVKNRRRTWVDYRDYALILLIYSSGMRISEALNFMPSHLLSNQSFFVRGKGDKERVVLVGKQALEALEEYLSVCPYLPVKNFWFSSRGGKLGYNSARNAILHKIGSYPHVLRHSFATHLIQNGCDISVVKELLGHESYNSTQIYIKMSRKDLHNTILKYHPLARLNLLGRKAKKN